MGINYFNRNIRDTKFVLYEYIGMDKILQYDKYQEISEDTINLVLDQAIKIGKNFLGPANPDGDIEGVILENNQVKTPASYKECWNKFVEDGWFSLDSPPEYYGMGLPNHVAQAVMEFFHGANFAFICYVLLTTGNAHLINKFASRKLKDIFCEKMYTGVWAGAMALTESNFGSDINLLATRAVPDGDTYKIKGTKIFITGGDHDLTENIIHLLLGRVEGDPEGAKGVSLFVVPKIWVREDGSLGDPNDVTVVSTEHKMGIHGSSTCTLNFGDENNCRAYLVGERGMGLSYMFQMMNESRMACAVESIGLLTNAYENCAAYAKERVQGFAFASKGGQRVRIIEHADIRRMLMNLKAASEGMRAMTMKAYYLEEVGHNDPDEKLRKKSKEQYDLLIPLCKAYCSDLTYKLMADAIQILGGYGFASDFPVEQFARDENNLHLGRNQLYTIPGPGSPQAEDERWRGF